MHIGLCRNIGRNPILYMLYKRYNVFGYNVVCIHMRFTMGRNLAVQKPDMSRALACQEYLLAILVTSMYIIFAYFCAEMMQRFSHEMIIANIGITSYCCNEFEVKVFLSKFNF